MHSSSIYFLGFQKIEMDSRLYVYPKIWTPFLFSIVAFPHMACHGNGIGGTPQGPTPHLPRKKKKKIPQTTFLKGHVFSQTPRVPIPSDTPARRPFLHSYNLVDCH
ncbi:hypothetical protein Dimus_028049 [Dionaea muscipula]